MSDALTRLLPASGPHPVLGAKADLYGQFIGSWDLDSDRYDETTGEWRRLQGECHFGWILGGRVIQDLWGWPPDGFGTTIRVYDSALEAWRIEWFGPHYGYFASFVGRPDRDGIMQVGTQNDGRPVRWSFRDIGAASFTWRSEVSDDGGETWWLNERIRARRRG